MTHQLGDEPNTKKLIAKFSVASVPKKTEKSDIWMLLTGIYLLSILSATPLRCSQIDSQSQDYVEQLLPVAGFNAIACLLFLKYPFSARAVISENVDEPFFSFRAFLACSTSSIPPNILNPTLIL